MIDFFLRDVRDFFEITSRLVRILLAICSTCFRLMVEAESNSSRSAPEPIPELFPIIIEPLSKDSRQDYGLLRTSMDFHGHLWTFSLCAFCHKA